MADPGTPILAVPEEMLCVLSFTCPLPKEPGTLQSLLDFPTCISPPVSAHLTFPPLENLKWDFQMDLLELDDQTLLRFQPLFVRRSQPPTVISLITVVKEENKEYCHLRSSVPLSASLGASQLLCLLGVSN